MSDHSSVSYGSFVGEFLPIQIITTTREQTTIAILIMSYHATGTSLIPPSTGLTKPR